MASTVSNGNDRLRKGNLPRRATSPYKEEGQLVMHNIIKMLIAKKYVFLANVCHSSMRFVSFKT